MISEHKYQNKWSYRSVILTALSGRGLSSTSKYILEATEIQSQGLYKIILHSCNDLHSIPWHHLVKAIRKQLPCSIYKINVCHAHFFGPE